MSSKPWISALNVPQSTYDSWLKTCPQNEPILLWCLSTGKISSDDYFSWAQEHYGLALLSSEFFKQKPDPSLWKKIQTVANWSADMIPILEWDGVIFIVCIEPRPDINWSFPIQFILANANDLKKYWSELHSDNTQAQPEIEAPAGLSLPPDLKLNLDFTAPEGLSPIAGATTSVIQMKQATSVAPDGLNVALHTQPTNTHSHYMDFLFRIENDFQGGMILSVDNEQIKALAWGSKFKPRDIKAEKLWSLSQPSAFRVVFRTKLPYLGHVVDTPVNREFFNSWGFDNLPEHILVQPVKNDLQMTHLILLLTTSENKNHNTLHMAEKLAVEFNQMISSSKAA